MLRNYTFRRFSLITIAVIILSFNYRSGANADDSPKPCCPSIHEEFSIFRAETTDRVDDLERKNRLLTDQVDTLCLDFERLKSKLSPKPKRYHIKATDHNCDRVGGKAVKSTY